MNTNDQPNASLAQWETQLDSQERQAYLDLFNKVDADNKGIALKDEAMAFFAKSSVPNNILAEIWEAADDDSKGFLTTKEFCTALKLIACAQHGKLTATPILSTVVPMPFFEGVSIKPPLPANRPDTTSQAHLTSPRMTPPTTDTISPDERNNYIQLFQSSGPTNGVLTGDMATSIFNRSKLPSNSLQHIWNLADTRNSGTLNQTEFIIAMHYISATMNGLVPSLPASLPAHIYAAATGRLTSSLGRQNTTMRSPIMRHNTVIGGGSGGESTLRPRGSPDLGRSATTLSPHHHQQQRSSQDDFHLTHENYAKYRPLFQQLAINETGSVSGADAVHFFRHSKLPETDLAKIWDLADTTSKGELSEQEFCLAMHLINRRMAGAQIPTTLPGPISQLTPSSNAINTNTTYQPATSQPPSAFTDLLGLDDQPSDTGASFTPNAPVPQQPPATSNQHKPMMETNFSTIQSQINTENSLIGSLQSQQHSMDDSLKSLQTDIEKEKQHLENLKKTASELTHHLEAQQKRKEELTRDLQLYRQESKHYQQRIDQSQQESRELENEISALQKQSSSSSPFPSPHQIPQSPPQQQQQDTTNVFALSSTASDHDLFANVQETPSPTVHNNNNSGGGGGSIDPFSVKHQQQKALSNATPTLNRLKEETEVRRAPTPNVDISEVEAKFPDLNMIENDFDSTPSSLRSPSGDPTPVSPSLSSVTSPPPSQQQHTTVAAAPAPAVTSAFSPFSSTASPNPTLAAAAAAAPKPSKYGFDLTAFEGPSQPSPSSSTSYRDDLTSLFGGLSPAQSPANPPHATTSSFDALFNVDSSTQSPPPPQQQQPSSTQNAFDGAFLH